MRQQPPIGPEDQALSQSYRSMQRSGSDGCPPPDRLTDLAVGEELEAERAVLADHVVSCRRCSEDLQILLRTHAVAGGTRRSVAGWLAAAAALAVLGIGILFAVRARPAGDAVRGGRDAASAAGVSPAAGSTLAAPPETLRWLGQKGAETYRVKLFDQSGRAIWESGFLTSPSANVPAAARASLQAGKSYFWTVEVFQAAETLRLGPYSFSLLPR